MFNLKYELISTVDSGWTAGSENQKRTVYWIPSKTFNSCSINSVNKSTFNKASLCNLLQIIEQQDQKIVKAPFIAMLQSHTGKVQMFISHKK